MAVALLGFVLVAATVIWRRGSGVARGAEIRALDRERVQLEAQKTSLERQIEEFGGRGRLGAVAEQRLHMQVPADSQVIVLPALSALPSGGPTRVAP